MKSRVVFMALLCLLLIFTGAFAETAPVVEDLVYTGAAQPLVKTAGIPNEGYKYYYRIQASPENAWSEAIPQATNAGDYVVEYAHTDKPVTDSSIAVTNRRNVKISPYGITVNITPPSEAKDYNGEEQVFPSKIMIYATVDYYTVDKIKYKGTALVRGEDVPVTAGPNAGTHTISPDDFENTDSNFVVTFTISPNTVTINPVAAAVTTEPEVVDGPLTFDNTKQNLLKTMGVVDGGTITYVLDDEYESETSAKARIPGTHTVKYYITPDINHTTEITKESPKTVDSVVINKLSVTATIEGNSGEKDYTGTEQYVEGFKVKEISETLYTADFIALADGVEAKAAGTDVSGSPYAMGLTNASFVNKNETCFDVTFEVTDGKLTITKAAIEDANITPPTLVASPLTYNGGKQPLIATAGSVDGGEMVYILDKDASNYEYTNAEDVKAAIPMSHTVHYYIVPDDNHTTEITKENPKEVGTVVIDKLPVTVKITGNSLTTVYNGEEQSVEGFEVTEISDPLYPAENVILAEGEEAKAAGTNVSTLIKYPMNLAPVSFTTLQDTLFDVKFEVTDGWLEITQLPVTVTITGNTETKVYNGEEQFVEGFEWEADSELFDNEEYFALVDGAEAKAKGTNVQDEAYPMGLTGESFEATLDGFNFNPTFNVTDGSLTITPLSGILVSIEGKEVSQTYDGQEHALSTPKDPVVTLNGEETDLYTKDDYNFIKSCARAVGTNVGEYPQGLKPECFENKNGNFAGVTFEIVKDGKLTINPLDVTVTITGKTDELTYTGEELSVEGYTATADSDLFNTDEDFGLADGKEAVAKGTDVREEPYMMGLDEDSFESLNDNFNPTFEVTDGSLTIKENAGVVVTIAGRQVTVTYTGEERVLSSYEEPVITLNGEPTTLYTTADFTRDKSCGIARGTDVAGSPYKMNLTDKCFTNTNANFDVTFNVTDGQINIIPLVVEVTITGNSDEKVYNGEEQSVEGYTFEADSELFTEEDFGLAEGEEAKASGKDVQDDPYPMSLDAEKFVSKNGNFEPKFTIAEDGSLTITPLIGINVAIEGKKASVPYDGKTHNLSSYKTPVITLNGEATTLYTADDFTRDNKCGKAATGKIDVGTYPLELTAECFTNSSTNFKDVTFEVTDGELTITPLTGIVVSIEGNKGSVTYDGKEHNISKYQTPVITLNGETTDLYTTDDFTQDETCGKAATGKTEVGTYPMELTAACFTNTNSNFEDVAFEVTDGALTIKPKPVTITAGSTKKYVYDGTALTNSEFTVDPEVDHEFTVTMTEDSTVTDASKAGVPNVIATVDGVEVTTGEPTVIGNFNVTTVDGVLQVSRREVTITAADAEQVYNGSALTSEDFVVEGQAETDDHVFTATMTENSTITNVGTQPNLIATVDGTEITPGSATIVGNYLVTIAEGELTVTPKEVTITAADGNWVYDGHTHRQPEFTASDLEEGDDHEFEVEMTAESRITRATTKPNVVATVDDVDVKTGEETEVGNYLVTTVDGTLTVTAKGGVVVVITGNNASVTYDGKEHTAYKYDRNPVEITLDGQPTDLYTEADFERDATCGKVSATNAGTYPMGLSDTCFTNKNGNFDSVTFVVTDGDLTIKPAEVTLTWTSAQSFLYTGKVHGPTEASITINGLAEGDSQDKVAKIILTDSPMTNAGSYTAVAEVTFDPANYVLAKGAQTEFKYAIKKAAITVDPAPVLKTGPLPYNGNYQALLESLGGLKANNDVEPVEGGIVYVINGQWKTNPDENPSADAVGTYTVSYYVTGYDTANYDCEADEAHPVTIGDITIRPAYATITVPDGQKFAYTGEKVRPAITLTYEDGTTDTYPYGNDPQKLKITITPTGSGTYPNVGTYSIKVESNDPNMSADAVTAQFEITPADYVDNSGSGDVTAANSFAVLPIDGLTYNGDFQNLVNVEWNENTNGTLMFAVINEAGEQVIQKAAGDLDPADFLPAAVGKDAGTYEVYYYVVPDANHNAYPATGYAGPVNVTIGKANLADAVISLDPSMFAWTGDPITVNPRVTFNGTLLVPDVDYTLSGNTETDEGIYTLTITAVDDSNFEGSNSFTWYIRDNRPNVIDMFVIGQPGSRIPTDGTLGELPATGFPTRVNVPLAVKPEGLNYADLSMRIQIPSIDVDVELAGVPTMEGAWKVEWLENRAGLLSGTSLPGEGYSIVAAHNTLNAEEVGPFVLLSTLQDNDTIFVNAPDGSMKLFRVFANELLLPNDMVKLASIAEQEENTLVLVTCENESADGGYLNRRVVFAKPLN